MGKARNGGVAYYNNNIGLSSCPLMMAQRSKWSFTNEAERRGKPPPHSLYFLHRYYHSQVHEPTKHFLPHPQSNSFITVRAYLHTIKVRMFYNTNLIGIDYYYFRPLQKRLWHWFTCPRYMTKTSFATFQQQVSVLLGHERVVTRYRIRMACLGRYEFTRHGPEWQQWASSRFGKLTRLCMSLETADKSGKLLCISVTCVQWSCIFQIKHVIKTRG